MRKFNVIAKLSGHVENQDESCKTGDGIYTLYFEGNARSTEKSIINAAKNYARLTGCKIEEVIGIEEIE